ncbi:MAG: NapC/NirT family cytochrome c [Planctomycetota bacterium]|nr:NapC/NirT family cytochrome c [Planctomycetota bacterium]
MFKRFNAWIPRIWDSPTALVGAILATVSGCTLVLVLAAEFASPTKNAYAAAALLLIVPLFFLLGLMLIPIGLWMRRRRRRKAGLEPRDRSGTAVLTMPVRKLALIGGLTFVNLLIIGMVGHTAMTYMDTPEFCGTACHSVMHPEYEAYLRSPHSRVSCVQCHIGPGASWAVKAKLDGARQLWHTVVGDYKRPIDAPVHTLRPSRDTCEQCHWPAKFHGSRVAHWMHYEADEANSQTVNVVVLKIGGENPTTGKYEGIHWHVSPKTQVRYEALDKKRELIGKVTVLEDGEAVREYLPTEEMRDKPVLETRVMDCVDCHNRPSHIFDGSPEIAFDWALTEGVLDASVPYLKKLGLPLLAREDRARDRASLEQAFRTELGAAYDEHHADAKPDGETLALAARGLATLYRRNVYPSMKIGWDEYPSHLGHRGEQADRRGCFRCHNETHATSEGEVLSQDCELCHQQLADEESLEDLEDSLRDVILGIR